MTCVIDASIALSWFFEDQRTKQLDAVLDLVAESGATVPGLWPLEVANALLLAHRRGRISTAFRHQAIERLTRLPIAIDLETNTRAWTSTLPLAEKTELSVYDASYLELAIRLIVPLASADRKLCDAAKRAGVPLIATA
jgi:predicted nucleic acid-binding protein